MSSGAVPSDRGAPPARLFVVCGRGCAASELESLFAAFGVVRDVRYVADKGVAYVEFSRDDPFAAARALERFGANDDASSSLEGGVASCREFLGGCERTIKIMRADDHAAPAGTPSHSVSVSVGVADAEEDSATADTPRARLAEIDPSSPDRGIGAAAAAAAAEDDPPRSRLFVVCPKNASQDTLRDAFVTLLVRLREEDETAAGDRDKARGDAAEKEKEKEKASDDPDRGDGAGVREVCRLGRDGKKKEFHEKKIDPARDLESVRAVPHKGVAFAKFSSAEVARRCMDAVARAGTLGDMRVKCMLAEPKAAVSNASAGDVKDGVNGEKEKTTTLAKNVVGAVSTARPRVAREGSRSPGGSPKRRRAAAEGSEGSADPVRAVSFERGDGDGNGKKNPQPPKLGVRPRPPSPASSAESGGARRAATRARASRGGAHGAFDKSAARFHDTSPSHAVHAGLALGVAAPPPPPHPPPPGHPTRPPVTFPIPFPVPMATPVFASHAPGPSAPFAAHASPPLPPGPAPWALAPSPAASGSFSLASGSLSLDASGSPSLGATSGSFGSPGAFPKPRVFVVLDKRATKSQLERAFRETCEGVDAVDLKKDAHGASRGFAYVTFFEHADAFAAAERLDGAEIPPGSGKRVKVMPAEEPPRRRRGARGKSAEAASLTRAAAIGEDEDEDEDVAKSDAPTATGHATGHARASEKHSAAREAFRRPREEEAEEDVSSWQPPPGKYPRVLAAGAEAAEDEDAEVASSLRTASLSLSTRASRLATEDEAGEAAAALGKVSLVGGGERETRSEARKDRNGESTLGAPAEARATLLSSLDEGAETRDAGSARVVFFSLALPLPSYAVRHVLDAKGVVAKLHMSRGGASGWAEYAAADDAAAAVAALDGTEILGIEFRVAATPPEGAERPEGDASEGSERREEEDAETSALETRAGAQEGAAAKKRARIAASAGS